MTETTENPTTPETAADEQTEQADSYSAIETAVARFDTAADAVDRESFSQKATPTVEELRDAGRGLVDAVHQFLDDLADASELATVDPTTGTVTDPAAAPAAPAAAADGTAPAPAADSGVPAAGDVAAAVQDNQPAGDHPDTFAL
jgi:hypothetical protein